MTKSRASHDYDARAIGIDALRATEEAAIAAYYWRGRGDETAADKAAVDALRQALNRCNFAGRIVVGEGERDSAPMLYEGEEVGTGKGPEVDIAVDPLECTTSCARNMPNSMATIAISRRGCILRAPDVYMWKIASGPGTPPDLLHLDASPTANVRALARFRKLAASDLQICILERERHQDLIAQVRSTGARVRLIPDGDILGVIATTDRAMGVDLYLGCGGAPEGVLAAAALACTGGFLQGKLVYRNDQERDRAKECNIKDLDRIYSISDMVSDDIIFAATGITYGQFLKGVHRIKDGYSTHSVMMRAKTGTLRFQESYHNMRNKAWLRIHSNI